MLWLLATVAGAVTAETLMAELDSAIVRRSVFIADKQRAIDHLKNRLAVETDETRALALLNDIYEAYHVFRFDSAMVYADRGLALATRAGNNYYKGLFSINMAEILAVGGMYSEAITCLDGAADLVDSSSPLMFKYYFAYFTIYNYWSDYCHDSRFGALYHGKAVEALRQALPYMSPADPARNYYLGESYVYVTPDADRARHYYRLTLDSVPADSRTYAMAAFALAGNCRAAGDEDNYGQYLARAAIADMNGCTMENLALRSLAVHLFESGDENIERALRYITTSMEDAKFYNSRLRILEISTVLPQIMTAYQSKMQRQNSRLRNYVLFISLLLVSLLLMTYYIHRQNRKIAARREELAQSNSRLSQLNKELAAGNREHEVLNGQLNDLNARLLDTNRKREGLAAVYIDLCARFIEKLSKYQTLVKRKIKANQAADLLSMISSSRLSDEDANTFLGRFDKAFLDLYPTFVDEFNALLQPDHRIVPRGNRNLTTELRTFALIRLGVKSTADIAGLLFLSNQTIYNCRSVVKSHAIDRDTFDADVAALCQTIA